MSELVVLALKVLFLALLWLFVLFAGNVIRTDLFGRKLATNEYGELQPVAELKKVKRERGRASRTLPTTLKITKGNQAGLTVQLNEGILIGRTAECQLILDDDYVSSRHARITRADNGYVVEDLGSTNGTYVNNERVTSPTPFGLADTMRIGRTFMAVER
ncbi:MAG: FHA domain-containing protein [Micropruina sp.]|nr:MAG: FHA domain-containing protein [Micropruina sp.]